MEDQEWEEKIKLIELAIKFIKNTETLSRIKEELTPISVENSSPSANVYPSNDIMITAKAADLASMNITSDVRFSAVTGCPPTDEEKIYIEQARSIGKLTKIRRTSGKREYGYKLEEDEAGRKIRVVDEEEQKVIDKILEMRLEGKTIQFIVDELNKLNIPSAEGDWNLASVHLICKRYGVNKDLRKKDI